jgi:outer membrane protein OmpA-like peptidoglycan-associated protein
LHFQSWRHATCEQSVAPVRLRSASVIAILAIGFAATARNAAAQAPGHVRVVGQPAPIVEWFPYVKREIMMTLEPGTTLEVLAQVHNYYWVVTPRDPRGTRRAGYIATRSVEVVVETARAKTDPAQVLVETPPASAAPPQAGIAPEVVESSDRVTLRVQQKDYVFEDVHFARNQHLLGPDETKILDAIATALNDDPSLRLSVEGYTCSLGTPAYNLALGERRANAVKDYLVGKGVPAERLRTLSFGENRPKHLNSKEETRRLNRRVALVPNLPNP